MKYWNNALDHNIVQEVHLWDYCKNASDRDFLYSLSNPTKGIFIRTKYTNRLAWTDYYRYYGEYGKRHPNDIIIKCDDDITFVDIFKLPYFISVLQREETDESVIDGVLFANIINNGVAAHYQQTLWNILPKAAIDEEIKVTATKSRILAEENRFKASDIDGEMEYPIDGQCGSLWSSGRKATIVHNYFIKNWESIIRPHRSTTSSSLIYPLRQTNDTCLSVESFQQKQQQPEMERKNKTKFPLSEYASSGSSVYYIPEIIPILTRFSINFFGIKASNWFKLNHVGIDDELHITVSLVQNSILRNFLTSNFFVSHLSFGEQNEKMDILELLVKYNQIFDDYIKKYSKQVIYK
jgi:hypothetical protein